MSFVLCRDVCVVSHRVTSSILPRPVQWHPSAPGWCPSLTEATENRAPRIICPKSLQVVHRHTSAIKQSGQKSPCLSNTHRFPELSGKPRGSTISVSLIREISYFPPPRGTAQVSDPAKTPFPEGTRGGGGRLQTHGLRSTAVVHR